MPEDAVVELTSDPRVVSREGADWLARHPWTANVVATVLAGELAGDGRYPEQSWALVRDNTGALTGVAMNSLPAIAWLPPVGAPAARAVAEAWHAAGRRPTAVRGDAEATGAFAARWVELAGGRAAADLREGVLVLEELVPPVGVPGRLREHREDDVPLLLRWFEAFVAEAEHDSPVRVDPADVRARHAAGRLLIWEDGGEPVSFAGWRSGNGVGRVGPVYTPPEHRRRGYGAAVTVEATRRVLAGGERAMLHTDLANATSNAVYERLGYRRVAELEGWRLLA